MSSSSRSPSAPGRFLRLAALPLSLAPLTQSCNDRVGCVFTTGCQGGSGAVSENEAALPVDGDWVLEGPPEVESFFPNGNTVAGSSPIVVVFSETIQEESLAQAFEIVPIAGGGLAGQPLPGFPQALVSAGRVLVMLPLEQRPLDPGTYIVRLAEDATVVDLTGQALDLDPLEQLGDFTVVASPPTAPQLVMTFPGDGADNQGQTTEIVAVFDRPVVEGSVDASSFDVKVNGQDPPLDPEPTPIEVGVGPATAPDTRAFLWRSATPTGTPIPLAVDASVEVSLSPSGSPIEESDGGVLAARTVAFDILSFAPPGPASILSDPSDAIGLANLTPGNAEELLVEVLLESGQTNDTLDLFLFGEQKSDDSNPPLIALFRTKRLTAPTPVPSALFTRSEIGLQLSNDPSDVRFEDGAVTFAFVLRRGDSATPVRVLDLDPDPGTILDPELDTTAPVVGDLVGADDSATFRSDQRGLSLAGDADERVRGVEVTTPLGDNGPLAPVVGSDSRGLFLAAPVDLGLVPGGGTTYSAVARDRAQNPSPSVSGTFTQLGGMGPDPLLPGGDLTVEVFDSGSFAVLPGARVLVHADQGNGTDFPFVSSGLTASSGRVTLTTGGAPAVAAIVTVVLDGYDLFTLHGVPATRLSVPLDPSAEAPARATGQVVTRDALALAGLDRRYDDSRRSVELPRGFTGLPCANTNGVLTCVYPEDTQSIRQDLLGGRSFFAGDFSQNEAGFSEAELLQAFALSIPLEPADPNELQFGVFEVTALLAEDADPSEHSQALPPFQFRLPPSSGVSGPFADDPDTTGIPFVTVESLVPGLSGSLAVAAGVAFDQGSDLWTIRCAMPGAVSMTGSLGGQGSVDPDPFVRVELEDLAGNAAGTRPRLSTIQAGGALPEFLALAVPALNAPAAGASTAGQAFTLRLQHVIGDERMLPGLHRVELSDAATSPRHWRLYRFDPAGTADVEIRVVDVGDAGAVGLADGDVTARTSAYAWSSLSGTDFLWSDVEREFELFSRAAPVTFSKP